MAKSSVTIHMDYQKALNQAERLENAAKRVAKEVSRLEQCKRNLSNDWKGESGTQFQKKMDKTGKELREVSGVLTEASETVRTIAERTYKAEMEALRLAQERKS